MNIDAIKIKYGNNEFIETDDFVGDGFVLEEGICSESQIAFGACEAAAVEITISSTAASFVGQTIYAYLGETLLGQYKVVSDERASDGETRKIKAYDALYDINGRDVSEWYKSIDWTTVTTLKNFRDSFFSYLEIPQVSTTLVNDSMAVNETVDVSSCSGATVLKAICELNGVFGHINPEGKFQYISLANNLAVASVAADEVLDTVTEDFTVPEFDSVLIRTEEGDLGGQYPSTGGENQYIITGNFLVYGKTAEALQTIAMNAAGRICGRSYIPYEAELECQNDIALGDKVTIPTEPETFTSYVLQRKLVGVDYLTEYFYAQGSPEYVPDVNSTRNQMMATEQRINKLTSTLEGTTSEVAVIKNNYVTQTTLEETARGFNAQVEEIDRELQEITDQLDGEVTSYNVEEAPTFRKNADDTLIEANYPAIMFTGNIYVHPTEALLIDHDIPFLYRDEDLKLQTRVLATDTTTYHAYRFVKEDGVYGWKQIADSDFGIAMSRIATLEASSEAISQTVQAQGLEITSQGGRITTAEGTLVTQANEIGAKVSIEGGNASTNASWSLKPEAFVVKSNGQEVLKVNNSGLTVNGSGTFSGTLTSSNATITGGSLSVGNKFSVSNTGVLTASGATISGAITSNSANITGGTMSVGSKFAVASDGTLTASNATISGNLTSNNATITGGSLAVGNNFSVANNGNLTASNANVSGTLTSSNATITGGSLKVGSKFKVTTDGTLTASNANISGSVTSDNATITGGSLTVGNKFSVANDGTLTASGATINGAITSTNANIEGTIKSSNATITGGSLSVGSNFSVNSSGVLTATGANISGTITSSNANIEGTIKSSNATITGGSLSVGSKFAVASDGSLTATDARFTRAIIDTGDGEGNARLTINENGIVTDGGITAMAYRVKYGWKDCGVVDNEDMRWVTQAISVSPGNTVTLSYGYNSNADYGYNTLCLDGWVSTSAAHQTLYIPLSWLTTSEVQYGISFGTTYLYAYLKLDSYGRVVLRCTGTSNGKWVKASFKK